jgi:NAD(P)-dependent dehydrogenase (short-subunit alcohol dehydrogenase family)
MRPRPSMVAYVTSKWALEGYVRTLQMELEGTGVRATVLRPGPTQTAMGLDWDPDTTTEILSEWARWGLARHASFMPPAGVARAVLAAVDMPRGTYVSTIELQPEAPIEEER